MPLFSITKSVEDDKEVAWAIFLLGGATVAASHSNSGLRGSQVKGQLLWVDLRGTHGRYMLCGQP